MAYSMASQFAKNVCDWFDFDEMLFMVQLNHQHGTLKHWNNNPEQSFNREG